MNMAQVVMLNVMTQTTPGAQAATPGAQTAAPGAQTATPARPVSAAGMPGDANSSSTGADAGKTLSPGGTGSSPAAPPGPNMFYILGPVMLIWIVMIVFSGRKDKKKREELMKSLQRGDKVITTGGIIGTVAEISDVDAVLRVEEGRLRVTRAAIQGITESKRGGASASLESKPEAKATV